MHFKKRILITGASGFVGKSCTEALQHTGQYIIRLAVRDLNHFNSIPPDVEVAIVDSLSSTTFWEEALRDCDCVIHTAGRAHIMKGEPPAKAYQAFKKVNVDGTIRLAKQAVLAGVKRFIFISSIKVNGEGTQTGRPFHAEDNPNPVDPYGQCKFEAEEALKVIAAETGLEVVIIRPPLIYGPGVKGNFKSMLNWLKRGWPVLAIKKPAKRSMVSLKNLTHFIELCITHPKAAQQTFLISDGQDVTVEELMSAIGQYMQKPTWFIYLPVQGISFLLTLIGKRGVVNRLFGSLQVDITKNQTVLGWTPPYQVALMLAETVYHYQQTDSLCD